MITTSGHRHPKVQSNNIVSSDYLD